jgi:hypothetical protein
MCLQPLLQLQGDTGSVIQATDSVRVKMVCPPAEQSLQAAQAFSAPEGFPANTVSLKSGVCIAPSKQQTDLKCYDDAVFFQDFTLQVGGVTLRWRQVACDTSCSTLDELPAAAWCAVTVTTVATVATDN